MDLSGFAYNKRLMENSKMASQAALLKKGQKPSTRPSREELISTHNQLASQSANASGTFDNRITYITHRFPPSITPLSELGKIYIEDLRLETNHRGSYIVLRTITSPSRMAAVVSVVEDENGGCELIQLSVYNTDSGVGLDDILPQGQVVIVKEPFYKLNGSGGFKIGTSICVEHVSDIIYLDPDDGRVPVRWQTQGVGFGRTAAEWKDEGNVMLGNGDFYGAIKCYTKGLSVASKTSSIGNTTITKALHLNRSQAFLKLSSTGPLLHDKALEDAQSVLQTDPTNEKALYRTAKALYQARQWEACKSCLTTLLKSHHQNQEAKADLLKVYHRLEEARTGKYDFEKLRALTSSTERDQGPTKLDCADFVGPVALRNAPGAGRGLFATRDVKFGELLLFTKAFHVSYPQKGETSLIIDITADQMHRDSSCDRWALEVIQKLSNNPSTCPQFLQLYAGPWNENRVPASPIDGTPIIDTFLIHDIRNLNSFICPILSTATDAIALGLDPSSLTTCSQSDGIGIWLLPSFINHACWGPGSSHRSTIGDMMIVRATADIPSGSQITLQYHSNPSITTRRNSLLRSYGFLCRCRLCSTEALEHPSLIPTRESLLSKILAFETAFNIPTMTSDEQFKGVVSNLPEILRLLAALENTYVRPPTEQPRMALVTALTFLAKMYELIQQLGLDVSNKIIETTKQILQALGYVISEAPERVSVLRYGHFADAVNMSEPLVRCSMAYQREGNYVMAVAWQEVAVRFYEVTFGERGSFFEMYREMLERG